MLIYKFFPFVNRSNRDAALWLQESRWIFLPIYLLLEPIFCFKIRFVTETTRERVICNIRMSVLDVPDICIYFSRWIMT